MLGSTFNGFSSISDSELDTVILDVKRQMPDAEQSLLRGVLQYRGILYPLSG